MQPKARKTITETETLTLTSFLVQSSTNLSVLWQAMCFRSSAFPRCRVDVSRCLEMVSVGYPRLPFGHHSSPCSYPADPISHYDMSLILALLAAHSMTSFFGQGACQAIEDATILANMLHRHYSPSSSSSKNIPDVLKSYAREREDRAKAVADFSASYAKVHTANLPLGFGPFIRKLIYGYAPAWVWMWYLKWLYGYQPSVDALGRDKKMQ